MKNNAKLFIASLGLGIIAGVSAASAASDAVLFKIHDVVPVKNADGNVVSCDVGATFYNRTSEELVNAALDLVWTDEVVADAINQEERNAKEAKRSGRRNLPRYNTATYNERTVRMNLRLPPMKPQQQVTLKSKVTTDRCFLLLNDMEVNVTNCGSNGDKSKNYSTKTNCNNLFLFVNPKSPEYYSEFKPVSMDELNAQELNMNNQQKQDLNTLYKETITSIAALTQKMKESRPEPSTKE